MPALLAMLLGLPSHATAQEITQVAQWTMLQLDLTSSRDYADPLWDATVQTTFVSPSGRESTIEGFWDGGRQWRVRFSPDEVGTWAWQTSEVRGDAGLSRQSGRFHCVPYEGDSPPYVHGALTVSEDRTHLQHADGTPFLWLADTAWNGVLRAEGADWNRYLATRRGQGFTAVQFVSTQWRGLVADGVGEKAYEGEDRPQVNPAFFRRLDAKVAAVNEAGLVAAPVILWAIGRGDPGHDLSEEAAARLARYIVARWGAHQVVWFLGGDGNYRGERAERWRRIGRAVFAERHDRLVTMHPGGQMWVGDEFRNEPWFDFLGYQSGHGDSEAHLRWLVQGPPASDWRTGPRLPVINLEPNYETIRSYHSKRAFTDREVRRAAYWSLLLSPTAGVSYGHNSIWVWPGEPQVPDGHGGIGVVAPWHEGLDTPGTRSMAILAGLFTGLPWWTLRPAQELLATQPGEADPRKFIAAARGQSGDLAVVYVPDGGPVSLQTDHLKRPARMEWFDPHSGQAEPIGPLPEGPVRLEVAAGADRVLVVRADG